MKPVYARSCLAPLFAAACALPVVAAITISGCGDSGDDKASGPGDDKPSEHPRASAPQHADELWGLRFTSTAVTEDGEPRPLVRNTRISVGFERDVGRDRMGWQAGCNGAGAKVRVTADELHIRHITSTLIGCSAGLQQQDEWLSEFFRSNPSWRLSDGRLTLTSGGTLIELDETDR
jgi:heat shock protein HslJ